VRLHTYRQAGIVERFLRDEVVPEASVMEYEKPPFPLPRKVSF